MRLVFLTPHTRISGGTKVIFTLADGISRAGHSVTVAALKSKESVIPWFSKKRSFELKLFSNISAEEFKNVDYAITFGDGPSLEGLHCKRILFFQGIVPEKEGSITGTSKYNLKVKFNKVIVTSKWLQDIVLNARVNKDVHIIPPGIDSKFVPSGRQANSFSVIGGLQHCDDLKNFNMFIQVIEGLHHDGIRVKPLILSAESAFSKVKVFDTMCLPYSIIKNPPQSLLPAVYSACDIWLSTSLNEGFGLTPLEAMACNVPVVWVENGGLKEYMKHEENCLIVKTNREAKEAIKRIRADTELKSKLISNGRVLANSFTWNNCIQNFIRAIQ